MAAIIFDFPLAGAVGLPLAILGLGLGFWRQRRQGLSKTRVAALAGLRSVAMLVLVFMAARPVWVQRV